MTPWLNNLYPSCFSTHMWVVLSSMYGKLVVLLTIAFCLTEVMDNSILPLTFQVRSTDRQPARN